MGKDDSAGGETEKLGAVLDILKQVEGDRSVEDRQVWSQVEELLREEADADDDGEASGDDGDDEPG